MTNLGLAGRQRRGYAWKDKRLFGHCSYYPFDTFIWYYSESRKYSDWSGLRTKDRYILLVSETINQSKTFKVSLVY